MSSTEKKAQPPNSAYCRQFFRRNGFALPAAAAGAYVADDAYIAADRIAVDRVVH